MSQVKENEKVRENEVEAPKPTKFAVLTSKNSVSRKFLLLHCIGPDKTLKEYKEELGFTSKQSLNYYLRVLKKDNLIFRRQSHPFAIYVLTPKGRRVKEVLVPSEEGRGGSRMRPRRVKDGILFREHHGIIAWNILGFGGFEFDSSKVKQMRNWEFQVVKVRVGGEWFEVHVHSTGLLKFYCPPRYGSHAIEIWAETTALATRVAQAFCDRFNAELGSNPKIIRKPHYALENSERLAKLLSGGSVVRGLKNTWVDKSPGVDELETTDPEPLERLLRLPNKVDVLQKSVVELNKSLNLVVEQFTSLVRVKSSKPEAFVPGKVGGDYFG